MWPWSVVLSPSNGCSYCGDAEVRYWGKLQLVLLFVGAGLAAGLSWSRSASVGYWKVQELLLVKQVLIAERCRNCWSAGAGSLRVQEQLLVKLGPGRYSEKTESDLRKLSAVSS